MAKAQSIEIAGMQFSKKGDALNHLKSILNSYRPEECLSTEDEAFLLEALKRHPDAKEKIGAGVKSFFVRRADYGTKCFWIKRVDGSEERFSYRSCV